MDPTTNTLVQVILSRVFLQRQVLLQTLSLDVSRVDISICVPLLYHNHPGVVCDVQHRLVTDHFQLHHFDGNVPGTVWLSEDWECAIFPLHNVRVPVHTLSDPE